MADDRSPGANPAPDDYGKETGPQGRFLSQSRDQALTRVLRRDEAASIHQLRDLGYSEKQIRGLVQHGDLERRHRGVYVDGRTPLSPRGHLRAALLALPPGAFLSHRTGAAVRGYRAINTRQIDVSVVGAHTPRIAGLTLHRVASAPPEVSEVAGLRVATLPLLLLQFAAAGDRDLDAFVAAAARRQTLDPNAMEQFFADHPRTPGIGQLKAALEYYRPSPEYNSGLEVAVHAWLAEHPEIPPPDETNVRLGSHEWDALWHSQRVAMEIDSREWHSAMAQKENDAVKDADIQRRGYRIVRITGWRFRFDRMGFYADLMGFLRGAQAASQAA